MLELIAGHRYILADGDATGPLVDYGLPYVIDSMKRDVYGLKIVSLTMLPVGGFIQ